MHPSILDVHVHCLGPGMGHNQEGASHHLSLRQDISQKFRTNGNGHTSWWGRRGLGAHRRIGYDSITEQVHQVIRPEDRSYLLDI